MNKSYFITGTDTEVGKTFISCLLLQKFAKQNKVTVGFKPIASGAESHNQQLLNDDALRLQHASSLSVSYEQINPYVFKEPIAPHIAAKEANQPIQADYLSTHLSQLQEQADVVIVEGAGGWRVPLSQNEYLSSWVQHEKLPVILVVGMKLGCLNHTILTAESIRQDGLQLAGWIANQNQEEMSCYQENIDFLTQHLKAPKLGEIPWLSKDKLETAHQFLTQLPL